MGCQLLRCVETDQLPLTTLSVFTDICKELWGLVKNCGNLWFVEIILYRYSYSWTASKPWGYNQCWSINEFWLVLGGSHWDLQFSQGEPSGITKGNNWFQIQTDSSYLSENWVYEKKLDTRVILQENQNLILRLVVRLGLVGRLG
jgi:hypothetical protein